MENEYAISFDDFLESNGNKFVIFISRKQYVIEIDKSYDHGLMIKDMIKKIRPNIMTDSSGNPINPNNSFYNDTIILLGYREPFYLQIEFPNSDNLSIEQFECLKEILNITKEYRLKHKNDDSFNVVVFKNENFDIEGKDYKDNLDELIEKCSAHTKEVIMLPDEIVIGKEFLIKSLSPEAKADIIINKMTEEENNGNPLLGKDSEYKLKGYSSVFLLSLFSILTSITIIIFCVLAG